MRTDGKLQQGMKKGILAAIPNRVKRNRVLKAIQERPRLPLDDIVAAREQMAILNRKAPRVNFSGTIVNDTAETPKRHTPVRVYTPAGNGPFSVIVYLHGGGFSLGNPDMVDNVCRLLSASAHSVVISVDYALSPEHKFPYALNEVTEVVHWVDKHAAAFEVRMDSLVVAGDSAGANLAAGVCMKLAEEASITPRFQVLICPVVDMQTDAAKKMEGLEELTLSVDGMKTFHRYYLNNPEEAADPYASPIFASLETFKKMPATVLITEQSDPLSKEALKYAQKLKQAGVKVTHKHYDGLFHDFVTFAGILDEADEAIHFIGEKLRTT